MSEVTRLLQSIERGDAQASGELLPLVYDELRRLAARQLAREVPGQTLQATALVHEAWLRLAGLKPDEAEAHWEGRRHFFAAAAEAMRRILIENARRKKCSRHGGDLRRVELGEVALAAPLPDDDLLALHEALDGLATIDPPAAELVKLRFFAGLTHEQAARVVGLNRSAADRAWLFARAWLYREIRRSDPARPPVAPDAGVSFARFSPDGRLLLAAVRDNSARIWDVATSRPLFPPLRHDSTPARLAELPAPIHPLVADFSPDGRRVVTGSIDTTARVWDVRTQEPMTEPLRHHNAVWSAEFTPDGQRLLTASADRTVQLWDVRPGHALVRVLPHPMRVTGVDWASDRRRVLGVSPRRVHVWELDTGKACEGQDLARRQGVNRARFSPDGQRLVIACEDGTATIWDGRGEQALTSALSHGGSVLDAQFSPDGRLVVTASADRTARLWRVPTGLPAAPPLPHEEGVVCAEFSPSGQAVVTASSDQSARVWDTASGSALSPPLQHQGALLTARFSPDGRWVVTASADETGRIWDWRNGRPVGAPLFHDGRVTWAEFSPDSQRVATASVDQTARLWDAGTGFLLSTGLRHLGLVQQVRFSPDGRWIATASFENAVRIWEIVQVRSPAPAWLPDLAEAVAGERLGEQRVTADVPPAQFLQLRARLQAWPGEDEYARWVRWFLADRATRPVSPAARHSARDATAPDSGR